MKLWTASVALTVAAGLSAGHTALIARAQQPVRTFTRTPDGNWRTTYTSSDGRQKEFVYVPPNQLTFSIRTQVVPLSARTAEFRYIYTVSNSATSAQEIGTLFFGPGIPQLMVHRAPSRWQHDTRPGSAMFLSPVPTPSGVQAGREETIDVSAMNLPGIMTVQAIGDVDIPSVPDELSSEQYAELDRLSDVVIPSVPAIGPTISAGPNEPELGMSQLVGRIVANYSDALRRSRHPFGEEIIAALGTVAGAAPTGVSASLSRVRELASRSVSDPWHQDMSAAMTLCMEALLSPNGPVR